MDSRRVLLCSAVSILVMYCALSWIGVRFDMSSSSYCANLCARPPEKFPLAFVSFFPSLFFQFHLLYGAFSFICLFI